MQRTVAHCGALWRTVAHCGAAWRTGALFWRTVLAHCFGALWRTESRSFAASRGFSRLLAASRGFARFCRAPLPELCIRGGNSQLPHEGLWRRVDAEPEALLGNLQKHRSKSPPNPAYRSGERRELPLQILQPRKTRAPSGLGLNYRGSPTSINYSQSHVCIFAAAPEKLARCLQKARSVESGQRSTTAKNLVEFLPRIVRSSEGNLISEELAASSELVIHCQRVMSSIGQP